MAALNYLRVHGGMLSTRDTVRAGAWRPRGDNTFQSLQATIIPHPISRTGRDEAHYIIGSLELCDEGSMPPRDGLGNSIAEV